MRWRSGAEDVSSSAPQRQSSLSDDGAGTSSSAAAAATTAGDITATATPASASSVIASCESSTDCSKGQKQQQHVHRNRKKRSLEEPGEEVFVSGHYNNKNTTEGEPPDSAEASTDSEITATSPNDNVSSSPPSNQRRQQQLQSPFSSSAVHEDDHHEEDPDDDDDDDDEGGDHAEEDAPHILWKPQNVQSTCEFTHTILDYAQKRESGCKKAEYSTVVQDDLGNRWRLIIYVNGNGRASNHHLSLFLQVADADDLPFGWKKNVSYVLTLEHPTSPNSLSYAKRNPDKTFKLCPKAIDWGWSQFITSDRIQQDGFVKHDALTVRAQVTVKSSSVAIDEEDAELYLKCAVEEGDAKSVKLCLEQGASVNCQFKDDLYTPLHTACSSGTGTGSMQVLNLLLREGADGNANNKWKETPLLIAANNGHRAAVEALLKHGANPSLCSEAGWSALTFAAHKGYEDIVALLLRAGAPVNCPVTEDSSTPLHKGCAGSKSGHLAAVQLLLENGADVHALNKWRETPLLTAANHGQAGAVEALLLHDADPCKCTDTGWSPLSIAAYKGHDEVVQLLLEDGAPTEEDDPTLSALLQAATKGLPDTVELLLRHGADHTVTTKKGDTALSILVEQNLIDAAVEMVTEYNASIPRCSRDRKKVQRARLLINLRMKQLERESKGDTEDEDTDQEDDTAKVAQHVDNGSPTAAATPKSGKKKNKAKLTAEEKARAAEEALLLELAKEDEQARREEAKANSKQAKKKKKKERERQQRMKEEAERRQREELEAKERERVRKEREEKERKHREERQRIERDKEMKEMMEREKAMAAKRKEREEREKRDREKALKQRESGSVSPPGGPGSNAPAAEKRKGTKPKKAVTDPTPNRKIVSPKGSGTRPVAPLGGNRRWETATKSSPTDAVQSRSEQPPKMPQSVPKTISPSNEPAPSTTLSPRVSRVSTGEATPVVSDDWSTRSSGSSPQSTGPSNGIQQLQSQNEGGYLEHPAITLFRREKVVELLQRCTQSVSLLTEQTIKRVIFRWVVRATHGSDSFSDPLIPSWLDQEQLVEYVQRQFISESRRRSRVSISGPSMESLKEAGSWVAMACQSLAKEVRDFRQRIEEHLPPDWTDSDLGMTVTDGTLNGSGSSVVLSWANRAQTSLPAPTFAALRDRYVGSPNRFLASTFVAKLWYESAGDIVADTDMDLRLSPETKSALSKDVGTSAELWSDPFSALSNHVFWGHFEQVDELFGGQKPFGKKGHGSEEVLTRHGGSVVTLLPPDAIVASQYVQHIVDILDAANASSVPVSFAVFLGSDCFHDPSTSDLRSLDPRLGEHQSACVSRMELLRPNQYSFLSGAGPGTTKTCSTTSIFVLLQNDAGKSRYAVTDEAVARIIASLATTALPVKKDALTIPVGIATDFQARESAHTPQSALFDAIDPVSPDPQRVVRSEFGTIGGAAISNTFSPVSDGQVRGGSRRGRLFDLVDDDGEEQLGDDIMSGMLNNLDVGLFQNTNVGSDNIDIEAISLMGIGGPPSLGNPADARTGQLG